MKNIESALQKLGYERLNPMQEKAVKDGLLAGSGIIAAPTASGKTLLAMLRILNTEKGKKTVYIVPLKALAEDKEREFKALELFGLSVGKTTGDLDSSDEFLAEKDVVIATSEKMDSLARHKTKWLDEVGLAIVDEIHVLNDEKRGPTVELVAARFKGKAEIMGLSATVPNAREMSEWLGGRLAQSEWRPTKLEKWICAGNIVYEENGERILKGDALEEMVSESIEGTGQALVFFPTRRETESNAKELGRKVEKKLSEAEKGELKELSKKILRALGTPTMQCEKLAEAAEKGVAFHHAGVPEKQRKLIEEAYKEKRILKAICCTTTLAMGIDYPASRVIVRGVKRFSSDGMALIPAMEVEQMLGRAGRPKYDAKGIGVIMCREGEEEKVEKKYVKGKTEKINSKIGSLPVLRAQILGLVAARECSSEEEIEKFYEKTFYAKQAGGIAEVAQIIGRATEELKEMEFLVERTGKIAATPVGKRVSELYVDPLSACEYLEFISRKKGAPSEGELLLELTRAREMPLNAKVKRSEEEALWEKMMEEVGERESAKWMDDYNALQRFQASRALKAWANEKGERELMEEFGLAPGEVYNNAKQAEWLCYAMQELAFLKNSPLIYAEAKKMRVRLKNGIKEELLELASIRGIGRIKARRLWNRGIKTKRQYEALSPEKKRELERK